MSSFRKAYKIKDFILETISGDIDFDKTIQNIRELSAVVDFYSEHNILFDLRETTLSIDSMGEVMKIATEFVQLMPSSFNKKIANVVPNNAEHISTAEILEACMNLKNFQFKYFTDFEIAIEWLSDVNKIGQDTG